MKKRPNWLLRRWRLLFRRCPYCAKKLEKGFYTIFLHVLTMCPDGHYAEEDVLGAGTIIYDNFGNDIRPPVNPPPKPNLKVVSNE